MTVKKEDKQLMIKVMENHPQYINRIGEIHITNEGYSIEIIERNKKDNYLFKFQDDHVQSSNYINIKRGTIKNYYHPSVCGIGYKGIGKYKSKVNNKTTRSYSCWSSMLNRCYNNKVNTPTYKTTTVCEEWHNFQIFSEWFYSKYNEKTMKGWELDKDLLDPFSKIYSPETCCLLPKELNLMYNSENITYRESCVKPFGKKFRSDAYINGERKYVGLFDTFEEGMKKSIIVKEQYFRNSADKYKEILPEAVYKKIYNYKVENY